MLPKTLGGLVKISLPLIRRTQRIPMISTLLWATFQFKPTYSFFFLILSTSIYWPPLHPQVPSHQWQVPVPRIFHPSRWEAGKEADKSKRIMYVSKIVPGVKSLMKKGDKEMWVGGARISLGAQGSSSWKVTSDWDLNDQPDGLLV